MSADALEFLLESNAIELEYSTQALVDAKLAWTYATNYQHSVTIEYILEIHRLLMRQLQPAIAGRFRDCDVIIGKDRRPFISRLLFCQQLQNLVCQPMSNPINTDPIATHIAFEKIHPFVDGNGRTGRILYNIHRLKLGLPIHIIHTGAEQQAYYQWFKTKT